MKIIIFIAIFGYIGASHVDSFLSEVANPRVVYCEGNIYCQTGQKCCRRPSDNNWICCLNTADTCCNNTDGCCASTYPKCCSTGGCCPNEYDCCSQYCCRSDSNKCCGTHCCQNHDVCCPNGCCPPDFSTCCPDHCCRTGYSCCGSSCCAAGQACSNGQCTGLDGLSVSAMEYIEHMAPFLPKSGKKMAGI